MNGSGNISINQDNLGPITAGQDGITAGSTGGTVTILQNGALNVGRDGLVVTAAASPRARYEASSQAFAAFLVVLDDDARKAGAALRLVLAQNPISSQLVDNLNASIHLRALLTDVFLIDEALKRGEG